MGSATREGEGPELVRENVPGPQAAGAAGTEQVAPVKRRPGRPRKAQPARPAPEPDTPAAAVIAEQAGPPAPAPRATTKDDKQIEAIGAQLAARGRQAGEHVANVSPLAGTVLATRAEDAAPALARVVGKFAPGLLKAGGTGMILFDAVTVVTSVVALGVAALVDAGRLRPDHPAAQRLGVTELAAQLVAKQAAMSQQLAQAAAGVPPQVPLDPAQYAYLQNQVMLQQQMQQQAAQQAQAAAAQQYAQQMAQARAQAQAYNVGAGLVPQFAAGG